ncbi:MAG: HAD-IIB family hydrolase [Clostridia bacterium]|nr:HAD-IIB family hydrolase [Clostridia bacterium]
MKPYQLIISDLDRTLLNDAMEVSPENKAAIAEIVGRGIDFVPSTGRTFVEIPAEVRELPGVRYLIYSDGAVIYDKQTNQHHCTGLSSHQVDAVWRILEDYAVCATVRHEGNSYLDVAKAGDFDDYRINEYFSALIHATATKVSHLETFSRALENVELFCVFFHSAEEQEQARLRLQSLPGVHIASSDPANLEIYSDQAGKGKALHRICHMLSVTPEATVAMGDSPNDVSMLKEAGLSLAVSNACDALKDVAHRVICSNEEHVAKYLLENILVEDE